MVPSNPVSRRRRELLWFGLFVLWLLAIGLGLRDPWPSDEPRFALVARWMVEHGQWLFPHRGNELYPDKPPMFMWLQALTYLATGCWRVAFLLPSLVSGLVTTALVYDLARRLWNHRIGVYAALLLATTLHFTYQFRNAQIDPVLVGWVTLANYGLLRHLLLGPNWRWFWFGCFFAGVGVITKGVGILALLMLLPYAFARRRDWRLLAMPVGAWRWAAGVVAFLLPVLAWLLPMLATAYFDGSAEHAKYVRDILFGQTVQRYTNPDGHIHGPLYFPGVILGDWLPFSLALPWAIPAWWRRIKRHDARVLLPLAWVLLVVMFFSFSPGKRDVYILPALPMAVLALAPLLPGLLRKDGPRRALCLLLLGFGVLLVLAAGMALWRHPAWATNLEASLDPRIWWLLGAIGLTALLVVALMRVRRAPLGWLVFAAATWSLYGLWGYPLMNDARSARGVMHAARDAAGPDATLGLVAWKEQNLLMAEGPTVEFGFLRPWPQQFADAVAWLHADSAHRRLFVQDAAMGDCVLRGRAIDLGRANRRDWWLLGADALVPGCVPTTDAGATDEE